MQIRAEENQARSSQGDRRLRPEGCHQRNRHRAGSRRRIAASMAWKTPWPASCLDFGKNVVGLVLNLEEDNVGVVLLGDFETVSEGDTVKRTGRIAQVPVGNALVDAWSTPWRAHRRQGPHRFQRVPQDRDQGARNHLAQRCARAGADRHQGHRFHDSIGRGQRDLIIGDRQTGKTALAVDTISMQKGQNMFCFLRGHRPKQSTVATVVDKLRDTAPWSSPPWCRPRVRVGAAAVPGALHRRSMGEYFATRSPRADDLRRSVQAGGGLPPTLAAAASPAGREAFPGDIFYLHSRSASSARPRCPPRKAALAHRTAVIETQAGDLSAYIPTNVISITDVRSSGRTTVLLGSAARGERRPSVSRVGGAAQIAVMKKVAGMLRLELAQYRAWPRLPSSARTWTRPRSSSWHVARA